MSKHWPYTPGETIASANDNDDKDGLAAGVNDYPNNSLSVFRSEAFQPFFVTGGCVWSVISGLNASMTAGVLYASTGVRTVVAGISSKSFSVNTDNYIFINETSGLPNYTSTTNGGTPPAGNAGDCLSAIIVTGASAITSVIQIGKDSTARPIYNTTPVGVASNAPRITSVVSAASITPNVNTTDLFTVTALATDLTINAPTGSPADGQELMFRIKDNGGGAQGITWNGTYRAIACLLPTSSSGQHVYAVCRYNAIDTCWDVLAVGQ